VGGEKWRRAVKLGGYEAIALWVAMKCYCSVHPDTEGFVPDEELDALPGAPRGARRRALPALLECGRLLPSGERGAGLVEGAEGGWRLHDYLDHSAAPEEIELRREKGRLRKQSYRESKRRELAAVRRFAGELAAGDAPADGTPRDMSHGTPRDIERDTPTDTEEGAAGGVPRDALAGACPPEGAREPAPTRAGALPSPAQPSPTKKSLRRLTSTIRNRAHGIGRVEACAAHQQFAAENGIELAPILDELRADPGTAILSADEIRTLLGARLASAAAEQLGGAA
jgi:hypothetical protein